MIVVFFFKESAATEIYPLSLHDALPIFAERQDLVRDLVGRPVDDEPVKDVVERHLAVGHRLVLLEQVGPAVLDRKSTRLNSSHANISYAVFCLKKTALRVGGLFAYPHET